MWQINPSTRRIAFLAEFLKLFWDFKNNDFRLPKLFLWSLNPFLVVPKWFYLCCGHELIGYNGWNVLNVIQMNNFQLMIKIIKIGLN